MRRLQRTDWGDVGMRMEEGASRVWRRGFRGAEEGVKVVEGEARELEGKIEQKISGR